MQHMNFDAYSPVSRIKGDLNEKIFISHSGAMIAASQIKAHAHSDGCPFKDSRNSSDSLSLIDFKMKSQFNKVEKRKMG